MNELFFNGAKLTELREKRGLTKTELANKLSVSQQYISDIELNRNKTVDDEFVRKLAIRFQTPKTFFYDDYENINFNYKPSGSRAQKNNYNNEALILLDKFEKTLTNISETLLIPKNYILKCSSKSGSSYISTARQYVLNKDFCSRKHFNSIKARYNKMLEMYSFEEKHTNKKEEIQVTTIKNGIEKIQFEDLDDKTLKVIKRLNEKFNLGLTASKEVVSEEVLF